MADLKFGDREYRKVDGIWMMHPSTLSGFIAVAEESTSAMLDEIERLRAEIVRLRAELFAEAYRSKKRALEIERLRELVADWADWAGVTPKARRRG